MQSNHIIVCPICGKKTWLRIQNGGYLNEYPIRVNCINCRALLKGVFDMRNNSEKNGLTMFNAQTEECDTNPSALSGSILKKDYCFVRNADYVAEISGELPCKNVCEYKGDLPTSPFLEIANNIDSIEDRKIRLECFVKNMADWNANKGIAFQLLNEGSIEYIATALKNRIGEYTYKCDHYLKALHCLQEVIIEETKYLFVNPSQDEYIKHLIDELAKVNKEQLHQFCESIGGIEELMRAYKKAVEVFSSFMTIYPNVLPAETFMRLNDKTDANSCISTCSFLDIKTFYQDGYESLISLLFIPVCLDNFVVRGSFQEFDKDYDNVSFFDIESYKKIKGIQNCTQYKKLDNGTRVNKMNKKEPYQSVVNIPANRLLRNGIGHNNIKYDGITQRIKIFDLKDSNKIIDEVSLMEMAIDCIGLAKSAVVYSEIILFMLREEFRNENITTIIHPRFYASIDPNMKCPCGSNKKYKKCCRNMFESLSLH